MSLEYEKVLIHGNFEILHTGHFRLFNFARYIGKRLVVALNTNQLSEDQIGIRLKELGKIALIDQILTFTELSELIHQVRPSVIVKGREHINQINPDEEIIKSLGGELIFSPGTDFIDSSQESNSLYISNSVKEKTKLFLDRNKISIDACSDMIQGIQQKKVLVVGDVIIDEYIECKTAGISSESFAPVARPLSSNKYLGGAGIVAAHCSALGAETTFLTSLGRDRESENVRNFCNLYGYELITVTNSSHPTVLKQRFVQGSQTLFRINRFIEDSFAREIRDNLYTRFSEIVSKFDVVLFSDFSYGVLDESDSVTWVQEAKNTGALVVADSQTSSQVGNLSKFRGATLISATEREIRMEVRGSEGLIGLSQALLDRLQADLLFMKLGPDGILVNGKNLRTDYLPALNENPVDIAGAGDALLAASSLVLESEDSPYFAAFLGSLAAAVQITRRGNQPLHSHELESALRLF